MKLRTSRTMSASYTWEHYLLVLNAESKIILETSGKKVDYVDFNTLQPIVNYLFISLS